MNRLIIYLIIGSLFKLNSFAQDSTFYTLEALVEQGLNSNYDVRLSELSERASMEDLKTAREAFYPNLYGNVSNNLSFGRYIDPYTYLYSNQSNYYNAASLNSNVVLYQGSKNINALKAAKSKLEYSKLTREARILMMKENITIAFININLLKALIANNGERLKLSNEEQVRMDQLYQSGKINKTVLLDLSTQKALVETEQIELQRRLTNESLRLGLLIGDKPLDITRLDSLNIDLQAPLDSSSYRVTNHPEYQQQLMNVRYYYSRMNVAKSALSPVLSLNGTIYSGYSNNRLRFDNAGKSIDYPFPTQFSDNFYQLVSLNLSIPFYSNRINKNIKRQAMITYQISEVEKEKRLQELNNLFQWEYQLITTSFDQVKITQQKTNDLQQAFELVQVQFFAGRIGSFEYIYRKQQFFEGKALLINDKYTFALNNKLFELHFGKK